MNIFEVHHQEAKCSAGSGTFCQASLGLECDLVARCVDSTGVEHHAELTGLACGGHIPDTQTQAHQVADLRLQSSVNIDIQSRHAGGEVNR